MKILLTMLFVGAMLFAPASRPVKVCRIVHGHYVCYYVNGGSGITPPVLKSGGR